MTRVLQVFAGMPADLILICLFLTTFGHSTGSQAGVPCSKTALRLVQGECIVPQAYIFGIQRQARGAHGIIFPSYALRSAERRLGRIRCKAVRFTRYSMRCDLPRFLNCFVTPSGIPCSLWVLLRLHRGKVPAGSLAPVLHDVTGSATWAVSAFGLRTCAHPARNRL